MPHSHTCINVHFVFSPLGRERFDAAEQRKHLHQYLLGICRNLECLCHACFVMPDHVHILVQLPAKLSVAEFAKKLKGNSSRHLNTLPQRSHGFAWQEGYGAFACSFSALQDVVRYIKNQEEHHKARSYQDEYKTLVIRHNLIE